MFNLAHAAQSIANVVARTLRIKETMFIIILAYNQIVIDRGRQSNWAWLRRHIRCTLHFEVITPPTDIVQCQPFQDDYTEALKRMHEYFVKAYRINSNIKFEVRQLNTVVCNQSHIIV